ncbi:hypothetical protein SVA_2302 [Sulfurifustis variabilis]|uniref:DUF883 domain-containing protein n=1 Tax=Sulfurifustis variabilis TaxID=1675686 RepID=A0A1B4V8A7_9GAMM|nr:DUF883 family protein [Sulfurifustis variabilis]BAU48852.1 hypothetical protein SVA_2302 [Sulfurifustis variabilis]
MAMEQAHSAVSSAEQAAQTATERLAQTAHETVDTLSEYGARAEQQLRETGRLAGEQSRELIDQINEYIVAHPMAAIGIAVGAGFLLGALARRGVQAGD